MKSELSIIPIVTALLLLHITKYRNNWNNTTTQIRWMGPIGRLEQILKNTMGFWIDTSCFEKKVQWHFLFLEATANRKTEIRRGPIFIASINFSSQTTIVTSINAIFGEVAAALDDLQSHPTSFDSSMRCLNTKLAGDFKQWLGEGLNQIHCLFCEVD
jgi:hypothetical protein